MSEVIQRYFPDFRKTGDEWHGPCPKCGGKDRFVVWPGQGNQRLFRVWCRQCNYRDDALGYMREIHGLEWIPAHDELGIPIPEGSVTSEEIARYRLRAQIQARREAESRGHKATPAERTAVLRDLWQNSTNEFVIWRLVESFKDKDEPAFRAAMDVLSRRMLFLTAFVAHQHKKRPVATERFLESLEGLDSEEGGRIFDVLGMDSSSLDIIDELGWDVFKTKGEKA